MKKMTRISLMLIMAFLVFASFLGDSSVFVAQGAGGGDAPWRSLEPVNPPHNSSSAPGYPPSIGGSKLYESIDSATYTLKPGGIMAITVIIWIANPTGCVYGNPCPEYDSSPEYINAWVDWDGNRNFEGNERVLDVALTGYVGINYYGSMSTSTIVAIPSDAVSPTWMRVNLGWGHDPNDPAEYSWTWGDIIDRKVDITASPPRIEEVLVTGNPDAKNPMTSDSSVSGVEKVKLEARIAPSMAFEVTKVSWSGDFNPGDGNPYEYIADPGSHGSKHATCTMFYKNKNTGEVGTDTRTQKFGLFFPKKGDDDSDGLPNWFEYWKRDGAVPNMVDANYDSSSTAYGYMTSDGKLYLTPYSADQHYSSPIVLQTFFGTESFGGPTVKGIDCTAEVIAHELYHRWVDDQWKAGGSFNGQTDSDNGLQAADCNDKLPDSYETGTSHTRNDDTDTYDLEHNKASVYRRYGDNEYMAMRTGNGARGTASKDWANLGKQSDPPYGCSSSPFYEAVKAEFTGTYSCAGVDTDGDGSYDYLRVQAEIAVIAGGEFHLLARLYDQSSNAVAWTNERFTLEEGLQSITLDFDGLTIRQQGVDGPYKMTLLLDDQFGAEIDHEYNAYTTAPYAYTDFEGKDASFSTIYSDYGTDTDGDGYYNYLTIEVGVNVITAGDYIIEAGLYDSAGIAIEMTAISSHLDAGSQEVRLNFDGLAVGYHRVNGPYRLRYLSLSGSPQIDFIRDAYATSAYSYTDFQKTDARLTGFYSDQGTDTDSDGHYNYLTTQIGIDVLKAGNYALIGWLYDSNGEEIVMASKFANLNIGSQLMSLDFDGISIHKQGVNGPYDLKCLTLYNENGDLMDTLTYALTTSAYDFTDFQVPPTPLIALTSNYWDRGTDADGDGVFDYLTVDVEVILADPGFCVARARLMDDAGEEIVWAENTTYLEANQAQIIQLNFDGQAIGDHGVDGPYDVNDVYIYHTGDPKQPDYVYKAHKTDAYEHSQFKMSDVKPPETTLSIGSPKYVNVAGDVYVASHTIFTLEAEDDNGKGSGIAETSYRIYNTTTSTQWIAAVPPLSFHICPCANDGTYYIDYRSTDYVGNVEPTNTATVILDNTPPTTTLTIGESKYISDKTYVTPDTPFTLEATDTGSGVYSIAYRINSTTYNSGWQTYTTPFKLTSLTDGAYTIEYNSTDNVQNTETTHTTSVTLFHWNYIYQDTHGRGTTLKINLAHKFFQFTAPSKDYGIRNATSMRQCGRAIIINHCDKQLRLITASVDTKTDFCYAMAWDLQTRKQYLLIDKAGIE
jgi:hypothetical protein